jgi:hypothetical protein
MRVFTKWLFVSLLLFWTCTVKENKEDDAKDFSFAQDGSFLNALKNIIILSGRNGERVIVIGDYQARVMTSTAGGDFGESYGWINYELIRSGEIRKHMNAYGGEDRFWLGPEGGQHALYFTKDSPFEYDYWQVPPILDTESFDLISMDSSQATFSKTGKIVNRQGTEFSIGISRQIMLLDPSSIESELGVSLQGLHMVGFTSINRIRNEGTQDWSPQRGLISIWILGMFRPSESTAIIIPFRNSPKEGKVTDDYFGAIPKDRIKKLDSVLLVKADAGHRGKVGISPGIAKNIAGSYDARKKVLTLVKFDLHPEQKYVNSKWEQQEDPLSGDAVNAYNDGPKPDGLGDFFELESSSPALALKSGEAFTHRHTTIHITGNEEELNKIAEKILGVGLKDLKF